MDSKTMKTHPAMKPAQLELPELADYRVETVFVDQFADAEARLRLDGFTITAMDALVGKGVYILHASRINRQGPDLNNLSKP